MMEYSEFLSQKRRDHKPTPVPVDGWNPPDLTLPFQKKVIEWATAVGRCAIFADCGMGKTLMQLAWADAVRNAGGDTLILAPLAVSDQTVSEGDKFGIKVSQSRNGDKAGAITITNYERLHKFDPSDYQAVVLDESSILKNYTGKIRNEIIEAFSSTEWRMACTATPSPNDHMELGNHSEFLGAMSRTEMLSMFFVHDGGSTQNWRLKGHARKDFWSWVRSWAVMAHKPSDLGAFSDDGFILPPLNIMPTVVESTEPLDGTLFAVEAQSLNERRSARRSTINQRASEAAQLVAGSDSPWIIWCDLNDEADAVAAMIPGAVQVSGSDTLDDKAQRLKGFSDGEFRVLVTKPKIAGFGMNWQHCNNVAFVGLSDSYEAFYQSVRRCWRFGQDKTVNVHVITSSQSSAVVRNIERKAAAHEEMKTGMNESEDTIIRDGQLEASDMLTETGDGWKMHLGDCVEAVAEMEENSIGYSIFSPPFASLYTYSDALNDMGNSRSDEEFMEHFGFLATQLFRVTSPGRCLSFHCMNIPAIKSRDGYIGVKDFRGELIRSFVEAGFIYHSEVCIWKDPVTAMQRTKALGLLHKQLKKDSCMSRQGIADYLVTMRKPGENTNRVSHTNDSFPVEEWQQYASPVWSDINPNDTLQHRSARDDDDERHICPLQLEVIRRGLRLWTRPGDLVLSPFAGIGSEGVCAIELGRRFVGVELKRSYFDQATKNLAGAGKQMTLIEGYG